MSQRLTMAFGLFLTALLATSCMQGAMAEVSPSSNDRGVASKVTVSKGLVILIPGITGSELHKGDGDVVWPPRPFNVFKDLKTLQSGRSGKPEENLSAGKPIGDYYGALSRFLSARGYTVREFGYDWRLDNRKLAEQLKGFIEAQSSAPVTLVAHSMGGLIAAAYLKQTGGAKVQRLITLGTPFLGTPGTLKTLERGDFLDGLSGYVLRPSFIELFKNEPSWYQLLPGHGYFTTPGSYYVRKVVHDSIDHITEFHSPEETANFVRTRPWANAALLAQADLFPKPADLLAVIKAANTFMIIGQGYPTAGYIDFVFHLDDGREVFDECRPIGIDGDGSVLIRSANLAGKAESLHPGQVYYIHEHHSALPTNPIVLQQIEQILDGQIQPRPGMSRLTPQ